MQFEMVMVTKDMQTDGRSDSKADAGNTLLQREADALLEGRAGPSLSEAWLQKVCQMSRRARVCHRAKPSSTCCT